LPDLSQLLIILPVLLFSLTIHEMAHAVTADWYGDPTARRLGRISLNPLVHLDPVGSVLLPLMAFYLGGFIFGWAKPVPVNTANLQNHRRDFLVIAAAGPASNIVMAIGASALLGLVPGGLGAAEGTPAVLATLLLFMVQFNLILAVFNMLPIPPLDGGNVLAGLLPETLAASYDRLIRPFGFLILIVLMATGWLSRIIGPPYSMLMRWLQP
jgi:Zn-dependent protease